jgi:hypothetical protein
MLGLLPEWIRALAVLSLTIISATACSPADRGSQQGKVPVVVGPMAPEAKGASDAGSATTSPPPRADFAYSTVDDWDAMRALEAGPASLPNLVPELWMAAIRTRLQEQVRVIAKKDPNAGVGIRGNSHRLFNVRWLREGQFELVGLTYRVERIAVDPTRCGDIRLVYRLAYKTEVSGEAVHSRLPMTLLVELAATSSEHGGCAAEARKWISAQSLKGKALADFLLAGALQDRVSAQKVAQVLVNTQIVRWPSAVRPSLGGHAEYSMLAFEPNSARTGLVPRALENMPEVKSLRKDPKKRAQLLAWIAANLPKIDQGSAIIPESFLAKDAVSVSPRGLSRRANRPFRQLFNASEFDSLDLSKFSRIGSPEALLRRLDDMSCVGCHQSRTIAGFHWLGQDDDQVAAGNALFVSRSVPLWGDARRRDGILLDLAASRTPSFARPFAARDDDDPGIVGSHCGLGDPGFAAWTCSEGLHCDAYDAPADDAIVGVCASKGPAAQGEACQVVALSSNANPHRDRAKGASLRECQSGVCNINRTGFPGGMCTSGCANLPADGACGVIALLKPFNSCLARKTPFPKCLADHVAPAGLRACDREHPCRDDYVCSRTPQGEGGCIPPYFLFQLRVDGHP